MKQISEVEEKQLTSSLNFFPEACCGKGWGSSRGVGGKRPFPPPLSPILLPLPCRSADISFEDDLTVIFLLSVSFVNGTSYFLRRKRT